MQVAVVKRTLEPPYCGDAAGWWQSGGKTVLCLADGLGHGKEAEKAARAALDFVGRHHQEPLLSIFAGCNETLRNSRGVAMALAAANAEASELNYAAVGNIRALLAGREIVRLTGASGIVGAGYGRLSPTTLPFNKADVLILWTDGITEDIDVSGYDALLDGDVHRLAESIIAHCAGKSDDAAVAVLRNSK